MLNYIRAEFYKVFHRKSYLLITLAVVLGLEGLLVAGWVFTNANGNHIDFYTGARMMCAMLTVGCYATLLTGDMVFASQYKHSTLKNEVSFGLPRSRIYLGKLIVQLTMSILFCMVMVAFYLGLCWLTLYRDPELDRTAMQIVGYCLLTAFPLWVGIQALVCACYFFIKSDMAASVVVVAVFAVTAPVLELAAQLLAGTAGEMLMTLHDHMPTVMIETAPQVAGDWAYCGRAWIVGSAWFAVFTAIGLLGFRKKEIK